MAISTAKRGFRGFGAIGVSTTKNGYPYFVAAPSAPHAALLNSQVLIAEHALPLLVFDRDQVPNIHGIAAQLASVVNHDIARIASDLLLQMGVAQCRDLADMGSAYRRLVQRAGQRRNLPVGISRWRQ